MGTGTVKTNSEEKVKQLLDAQMAADFRSKRITDQPTCLSVNPIKKRER